MLIEHMKFAIELAEHAENYNEVPVGCVIADHDQKLVSYANNTMIENNDPTCHAEVVAIRNACKKLKTTKLFNFSIYVTLEPCQMCEALIINVGIKNIFFGAYSDSLRIHKEKLSNYFLSKKDYNFIGGFEEKRCSNLLIKSFKKKR